MFHDKMLPVYQDSGWTCIKLLLNKLTSWSWSWQVYPVNVTLRQLLSAGWASLLYSDGTNDASFAEYMSTGGSSLLLHCVHTNSTSQLHLDDIRHVLAAWCLVKHELGQNQWYTRHNRGRTNQYFQRATMVIKEKFMNLRSNQTYDIRLSTKFGKEWRILKVEAFKKNSTKVPEAHNRCSQHKTKKKISDSL